MTKRIDEWDFIKGFLIIMVMLGHTTASLGEYLKTPILDYFSSLTVSFIMPFFLITTGYFIYSENGNLKDQIIKKFRRLLVPAVMWGGYCGVILAAIAIINGSGIHEAIIILLKNIKYLWYLYATFVSAVIITMVRRKAPKKMQTAILITIAVVLHCFPTDLWNIAFAFSFILFGHLLKTMGFKLDWFHNHRYICAIICATYAVVLIFFKYKHSIYVAGTNLVTNNPTLIQMGIDGFRFLTGLLGSISIAWILDMLWKYQEKNGTILLSVFEAVRKVGVSSLQMYCTQYFVIEVVFAGIITLSNSGSFFTRNPYMCYFLWRHVFGLPLIWLTYMLTKIIEKWKIGKIMY